MSAAASLSHQQWEQQLSGIIERTNANLNALSTRYSPARPAESVRRSAERQSWDAFEERDRRPVPSESVETSFVDDDAIERSVARALARWNVGNVQGGDNALQRLEDEVATLRASETAAATARRSREATVDALAREVHARRGHASKMLAWQADAEQWRSRVDSALEKAAATQAGLEASQRRISESNKRSATQAEVKGVLDAARRQAQAAAQGAVAAGQSAMEHELEDLRRQVAALRLRSGESLGGDDMAAARAAPAAVESAVQAAVQQAFAAAESKLEDKLTKSLGSSLRAEASEALMDARRQLENTLDSRAAALGGGSSGSYGDDDRAAKAVDKAVAKLVGDVDSARNEVDELKRAREADLRDARLAQKKLEQQLETVRAECADKIGQVVEATRTARAALDDARAATHKSLDSLRTELYGALDQRSDDWRDDRADLVRGLARCDRAIGAIEGKLDVAKTTARAFAEEAPAVKRAGELAGKVESVDARVDALDAKVGRFRDAERRSATDRARLDALETWQRGDASEAFEHLAALDAAAELQRDVVQRVGRLEEASTSYRAALGELAPQRLATCGEKLQALKQALDDNERAARDRGRELESALGDARDALETNLASFGRRVDEGAARASQAADAAEAAREIADAIPKRVDAVRDRVAALEESATEPPSTPGRESLRRYAESPTRGANVDDDARQRCADLERKVAALERAAREAAAGARGADHKASKAHDDYSALALRVDDVSATVRRLSGSGASPPASLRPRRSAPSSDVTAESAPMPSVRTVLATSPPKPAESSSSSEEGSSEASSDEEEEPPKPPPKASKPKETDEEMARRLQAEWSAPAPAPSTSSAFSDPFGASSAPSVASSGPGLVPPSAPPAARSRFAAGGSGTRRSSSTEPKASPAQVAKPQRRSGSVPPAPATPDPFGAPPAPPSVSSVASSFDGAPKAPSVASSFSRGADPFAAPAAPSISSKGSGFSDPFGQPPSAPSVSSDPFAVQGDAFAPAAAPSVSSSSLQDPAAAFRTPGPSPFEQAIANRRAKTEAQKPPASSSSYETDSEESDEESSASEESPVKAPRPADNSELMNRFRSRLQASGSRSPPKRYASDSD